MKGTVLHNKHLFFKRPVAAFILEACIKNKTFTAAAKSEKKRTTKH